MVSTMDDIGTEFVMELFLDDNVSTINRLIVAAANVVNENFENISRFDDAVLKENSQILPSISNRLEKKFNDTCSQSFYERIVINYSDADYIENFQMSKATVQALLIFLKEYTRPCNSIVPLDKKLHIFLWLLTNDASFKEVAEKFGLHKSSVSYIFHEIAALISDQRHHYIHWPSVEEQHITRVKVNSKYSIPNCVGFIDACRLKIGSKRKRRDEPKIVLLQAVCDETFMFIDTHVGEIGNERKGRVFRSSPLSHELKNFIDFDNHILGDTDYKLRKNLITPFSSNELLTSEEIKFNEVHWKAHSYIRQAFGLFKGRFKKLNYIDISKPEAIETLIYAACFLHNFILLHEGSPVKEEAVLNDEGITMDANIVTSAVEKRQFLCNYVKFMHYSD